MLILSIDSSSGSCSACLWRNGGILAHAEEQMERGQDQRLLPLINEVMRQGNAKYTDLDRIAVTRGPGSFTGLRIGLAAARGLGLAAAKPVIGIDRFSVYREGIKAPGKNLLVVIDSKRIDLFCRFFPAQGGPQEPCMMTVEEILAFCAKHPDTVVTGDREFVGLTQEKAAASETALCALLASRATPGAPEFLPRPLYIRAPDVTFGPRAATGT